MPQQQALTAHEQKLQLRIDGSLHTVEKEMNLPEISPYSQARDGSRGSQASALRPVTRVAIVGAGLVGSTTAYALLISGAVPEIVLIGRDTRKAEGHVHDLRDAELYSHTARIVAGEFSDCRAADVIVITAGAHQTTGLKTRLDELEESSSILREVVREISRYHPEGILLIASNPVDVLTYAALKWSGLPASRVIGSGTSLDTSRLRRRISESYGVAPDNVHAYVIGEHGDGQVAVLSTARIAGIPLEEFCQQRGLTYEPASLHSIANETRTAGVEIQRAKGATHFGIAAALVRIVSAILRDEHSILTVSSLVPESMNLGKVCLSLPSVINRDGVARVLSIPLNETERQAMHVSAEALKRYIAMLNFSNQRGF